jgi:hypothetical protein
MSTFELRPPPGARDAFVQRKPTQRPARAAVPRASLKRYSCPCGCGRSRWFTQPRVPRSGSAPAKPGP